MVTIQLNILEEHALEVIQGLEKLRAVEVVKKETVAATTDSTTRERINFFGVLPNPSPEFIEYFENVRDEWEERI